MLLPWFWHPWGWFLGSFAFSPFSSMVWAGCSCSSQAVWAQAAALDLPGNSGVKRQTKPNADLNFIFPPTKLVQQHEKSLQITWTSLGRRKLTDMQDQAVLPCTFPSELFLGLCLSCLCLWKDCSWCEAALGTGLPVPFCTNLLPSLGYLRPLGSVGNVFRHLLNLTNLGRGSCDLFADILRGHSFSLVQGSKQIHKRTWCAQKLQEWAYIINVDVTSCGNLRWLWGPEFGQGLYLWILSMWELNLV